MTQEERTRTVLFGTDVKPTNLTQLSKRTGIARSTLSDYKKNPLKIPLNSMLAIMRAQGIKGEDMVEVFND